MMALAIAGMSRFAPARAQQHFNFDPVAIAKLRAGEIAREIEGSVRDTSIPEPSRDLLLLQAGLRALLPAQERQGVALAGHTVTKRPAGFGSGARELQSCFRIGSRSDFCTKSDSLYVA